MVSNDDILIAVSENWTESDNDVAQLFKYYLYVKEYIDMILKIFLENLFLSIVIKLWHRFIIRNLYKAIKQYW
jgi:hypothetical protein